MTRITPAFLVLSALAASGSIHAADRMDIVDFKTDKASLSGRDVELEGFLMPFVEGRALLVAKQGDLNPVFIDISKVDRSQLRQLMECSSSCKVVVRGKVSNVPVGHIGIVADTLTFAVPIQ